jgi:predicted nucleic acid-binding protein
MLTVDANVFISAASASEADAAISKTFIRRVSLQSMPLYCPTLLLPEVAAGIARPTGNIILAKQVASDIARLPSLVCVELDELRADLAADAAITCRLRGADAVYVAVAQEYGTTLITWDQELLTRGATAATVMTPVDWLAANLI